MKIKGNVETILSELPQDVTLVAATKTRTPEEILEAVEAGIEIIGENYAQEAQTKAKILGNRVKYHFIGHLQRNKIRKILDFINMIETIDSIKIATELQKRCEEVNKKVDVLIEINSGREQQKAGVFPESAEELITKIARFHNISIKGLMTMGPMFGDPEGARPFFVETKKVFEGIKSLKIQNVEMKYLSMGMSNSYAIAIEEGANIVRIGTRLFGSRKYT